MKRLSIALVAAVLLGIAELTSCQVPQDVNINVDKDVVVLCVTSDASDVTPGSAILNGTVLISGLYESASAWFLLGKDAATLATDGVKIDAGNLTSNGRSIFALASGLDSETTYYYQAIASVDGVKEAGAILSFTTKSLINEKVITGDVSYINQIKATLEGYANIEEGDGGSVGFIISKDSNPSPEEGEQLFGRSIDSNHKYSVSTDQLAPNTTYYYRAFYLWMGNYHLGLIKSFVTKDITHGEMIDLGLSVKWRGWNLGASSPEQVGDYYAWGETEPYYSSLDPLVWKNGKESGYDWDSYKWCLGAYDKLTKYCWQPDIWSGDGTIDGKTILDSADDAAYIKLGEKWRTPTIDELIELSELTYVTRNYNGVAGLIFCGNNDNCIFMPFAKSIWGTTIITDGDYLLHYWSSSILGDEYGGRDSSACGKFLFYYRNQSFPNTTGRFGWDASGRCHGFLIRPVSD